MRRVAKAGGEEALQEASSQVLQNLIAKGVYKPEEAVFGGVGKPLSWAVEQVPLSVLLLNWHWAVGYAALSRHLKGVKRKHHQRLLRLRRLLPKPPRLLKKNRLKHRELVRI